MFKFLITQIVILILILNNVSCTQKEITINVKDKNFKLENGNLIYKDQPFTGILESRNDTIVAYKSAYLNGQKHGEEIKYFNNGIIAEKCSYTHGKKSGEHKAWWSKDQIKFIHSFDDKGKQIGKQLEWHSNGQILKEFNYINGEEEGSQKMWTRDGNVKTNYIAKNGQRFGLIGSTKCKSDIDEYK